MKNNSSLLAMMAFVSMGAFDGESGRKGTQRVKPQPTEKEIKFKQDKVMKNKGLTEYKYGEKSVWALNKKSADKKAIQLGWL